MMAVVVDFCSGWEIWACMIIEGMSGGRDQHEQGEFAQLEGSIS